MGTGSVLLLKNPEEVLNMDKAIIIIFSLVLLLIVAGCTSAAIQETNANTQKIEVGKQAPDATFTTIDGKEMKLSDFKGQKVMFWFLATWCPSCVSASKELDKSNADLEGIMIIAMKNFGNSGYPGSSIGNFAKKNALNTLQYDNWIWADASQEATLLYNFKGNPDIYFLVDEEGILVDVDGAPAATIGKIKAFAQG